MPRKLTYMYYTCKSVVWSNLVGIGYDTHMLMTSLCALNDIIHNSRLHNLSVNIARKMLRLKLLTLT